MSRLYRATVLVGILAVAMASQACRQEKPKIAVLLKSLENPFFVEMKDGVDTYVNEHNLFEKYDVDVKAGQSESDVETQRKYIRQFSAQGYKVLCITPSSSSALNSLLADTARAGMSIIVVDTKLDSKSTSVPTAAYIGSDNYDGGRLAAQYILKRFPSIPPRIIFFEGVPDQETAQKRKAGFLETIKTKGIQPTASFVADWNKDKAYEMMNSYLAKGAPFDAVFASNDQMALGVAEALESRKTNATGKVLVGFDAIPEALEAVKSGKLSATVRQKPRDMGAIAMEIAVSILEKKPYNKDNPIKVEIIEQP